LPTRLPKREVGGSHLREKAENYLRVEDDCRKQGRGGGKTRGNGARWGRDCRGATVHKGLPTRITSPSGVKTKVKFSTRKNPGSPGKGGNYRKKERFGSGLLRGGLI